MAGIFTISLDYELHWGVFDKKDISDRKQVYQNTLRLVPRMLELFEKYDVHVTWATVGSMFAKNYEQWSSLRPDIEPHYERTAYSAYEWLKKQGNIKEHEWALFSPATIKQIQRTRGQELATHTFSHYYCLEQQYAEGAFDADLKSVVKAADLVDADMVSLVFPRNQFNPSYLRTCYSNGIRVIRSNPANWFWKPVNDKGSGLIRKIIRTSDAYISTRQRKNILSS